MIIQIIINGKTINEELPDAIYGTIDRAYYKRKRDHNITCIEKEGCHYGFCNATYCHCCGEPWKCSQ